MPTDLLMQLAASEGYEPQCHLCALLPQEHPEAARWLLQQLVHPTMSQTRMAQELRERWGFKVDQSQISVHRVHHVMPELRRRLRELTALEELQGLEPVAVLENVALKVIAEIDARFKEGVADKEAGALHKVQLDAAKHLEQLRAGEIGAEEAELRVERMQRDAALAAETDSERLTALLHGALGDDPELEARVIAKLRAGDEGSRGGAERAENGE